MERLFVQMYLLWVRKFVKCVKKITRGSLMGRYFNDKMGGCLGGVDVTWMSRVNVNIIFIIYLTLIQIWILLFNYKRAFVNQNKSVINKLQKSTILLLYIYGTQWKALQVAESHLNCKTFQLHNNKIEGTKWLHESIPNI